MVRIVCVGAILFAVLVAGGCSSGTDRSGPNEPGRADELREVGTLLTLYGGKHPKGPGKPADLAEHEVAGPLGYAAVKSGDVVVVWGATMPGEGDLANATTAVVAYEKKTPKEGGLVLLHNGTVKTMTADEFAAAPKAK